MRIFLLWDGEADTASADKVGADLARTFAPLLVEPPDVRVFSAGSAHFALLQLPVREWNVPFLQEDDGGWAAAIEYPINAASVLRGRGVRFARDAALPALARELMKDPSGLLEELAPPFALIHAPRDGSGFHFFTDGLGQAQVFEAGNGRGWAMSNKVSALRHAGIPLVPDALDWAVRLTLGWFPLERTGFAGVRRVGPGEQRSLGEFGVRSARHDTLSSWLHPPSMTEEQSVELARESLLGMVDDAMELWGVPTVGLSGGWDSRMITACLRARGAEFELRVRGTPKRFDVIIAHELARIAGLPIRLKTRSGKPPGDPAACRRSIELALLWQAGAFPTRKHKTFLGRKPRLDGGIVNVMGQHGGLGKADFAVRIDAGSVPPERYETELWNSYGKELLPFLRPALKREVETVVREAYRQADRYALDGLARLHFFFLNEYTRCWGSAAVNAQTGVVFAPILNPGFIRAAYAFPPEKLPSKPFHRGVTRALAPDWADVLYEDAATKADLENGRLQALPIDESRARDKQSWDRPRGWQKYDNLDYWREVGLPLVEEALAADGFANELFDLDRARKTVFDAKLGPDAVVIAHLLSSTFA